MTPTGRITDKTAKDQTDALTFEYELAHPPAKVWRAITEPALLSQWLLPAFDFKLERDARFKFKTDPQPGWDGVVSCRMIDIDEPRRLSYAWVAGEGWLDTVVTFTLEPVDGGTRLTLVQSGFKPEQKQNLGGARYGWKFMGGKLVDLLDSLARTV